MMDMLVTNDERIARLRTMLAETPAFRERAYKLAWEWVKKGTFSYREFARFCDLMHDAGYRREAERRLDCGR